MHTEVAEIMKQTGRVFEMAEKTHYRIALTSEEQDAAEVMDAWARQIGETGHDPNHELAAFLRRTLNEEIYNAPDELLDMLFNRSSIGEFDDVEYEGTAKNTLRVHEAAKGGNVDRSYLDYPGAVPVWRNFQVETDISYVDLRKQGWKKISDLTTYAKEALQNKLFAAVFGAVDAMLAGGDQVVIAGGTLPTMTEMDALALYLNEYGKGEPVMVMLQKYAAAARRMAGFEQYLSPAMKEEFNRYGILKLYDGVQLAAISSAHKLGDGSLQIPDKRIFGIADKIGHLDMKGDMHVYEDHDNNNERIHLSVKDFTFGYAITNPEYAAKMVLN